VNRPDLEPIVVDGQHHQRRLESAGADGVGDERRVLADEP
jgi:hypothetical protein